MARPQTNSLPPLSSTFPATADATPSTITRSMSRRTLVSSRPTISAAPSSAATGMIRSKSGLPRARPSLDLSAVASSSASTSASHTLARSRTSGSLASRGSNVAHKTSTTARRRVLGEAKNIGVGTSGFGTLQGAKTTGARRLGRAEAGALKGMGVVRTGPAVKAPRSPKKLAVSPQNDPFSTSFKAPAFTFESTENSILRSPEKAYAGDHLGERKIAKLPSSPARSAPAATCGPFDLTSPRKENPSRSPTKLPHLSPSRRRLFGAGERSTDVPLHDSPPIVRSSRAPDDDEMDVDHNSILPSSPFPQARTPRSLAKEGTELEESSEDELDFLSPRKKKRSTSVSSVRDEAPSTTTTSSIRSPPKKRVATANRHNPTSVPMARSAAIRDPSAEPPALPPPVPSNVTFLAPVTFDSSHRASGLVSKYTPRPSIPHAHTTTFGYHAPTASTSSKTQAAALGAVQLAQQQAQAMRSASTSSSGIPRLSSSSYLPRSSTMAMLSAMDVDDSTSASGERSFADDRSTSNTTITNIEEEDEEADEGNSSSAAGNVSICSTSDETSKRLANLQSMLSRLQMPRQSAGSRTSLAGPASTAKGPLTGAYTAEYTVPLAPADNSQPSARGGIPRSRASLSNVPSAPSSAADNRQSGAAYARRRHSISTRPSTSSTSSISNSTSTRPSAPSAAPQSNIRPPRCTSNVLPTSSSTATIAALADGELGVQPKSHALRGVVAFVDVRTGEGDDASAIFVDMLKSMGARVTTRPTSTLTHIVYKTGRPGTLQYYRAQSDPKPLLVGISWVVRCAEVGQRVEEASYLIQCAQEPTFHKRRRSMEPKALAAIGNLNAGSSGVNASLSADSALKATIAASIERARRKSLQFAPKIGSPLAKRVFVMPDNRPDEEDDETF